MDSWAEEFYMMKQGTHHGNAAEIEEETNYVHQVKSQLDIWCNHIEFEQYIPMPYTICEFLDLIDMRQKVMLPSKLCSNLHILSRNKYKLHSILNNTVPSNQLKILPP